MEKNIGVQVQREFGINLGVFACLDANGNQVAVKVCRKHQTSSDGLQQARNEFNILTVDLKECPGVSRITNQFETDSYFVLMLSPVGETLSSLCTKSNLPLSQLKLWASELAEVLHGIHDRGVIHLDVKPDNIIITPEGKVVLIDFGLAIRDQDRARHTNTARGTRGYCAPFSGTCPSFSSDFESLAYTFHSCEIGIPTWISATASGAPPIADLRGQLAKHCAHLAKHRGCRLQLAVVCLFVMFAACYAFR